MSPRVALVLAPSFSRVDATSPDHRPICEPLGLRVVSRLKFALISVPVAAALFCLLGAGSCTSDTGQSSAQTPGTTATDVGGAPASEAPDEAPSENEFALKLVNAGRALAAQGDHEDALGAFDEALAIAPDSALANLEWGISAQMVGRAPETISAALNRAKTFAPKNPRAQFEWALFEESQGRIVPAIDGYRATLRLRADHARARARLGALRLRQGNPQAAVESLKIAIQLDPKPVPPRVTLAEAAETTGDVELAAKMLRSLVAEFPAATTWRQRLVALYDRAGDRAAADRERKALENAAPKDERKLRPLKKRRKRKRKARRR